MGTKEKHSEWAAWWAVFVLFLAFTLSFIDRTIISLLVEPLRNDLGLSDFQISLLQGFAFTFFYSTMALPIAFLSDRHSRPLIIGVGVFIWSAMTAACGFVVNFIQLFLARMGVGIGEAALGPAAFSLIADLFPPEKRGRAMAIFSCGISVGGGLAFLLGGYIIEMVNSGAFSLSFMKDMASWQVVFIVVGVPGMIGALLFCTVPEPRTKKIVADQKQQAPEKTEPVMPFLKSEASRITALFVAFGVSSLIAIVLLSWAPTLIVREFEVSIADVGKALGLGILILGPLGAFTGGFICDLGIARGINGTPYWVGAVGLVLKAICVILAVNAPSFGSAALFVVVAMFFASMTHPAGGTALQALAPARIRARVAALYLLAVNLIAATIGPTMVAVFTDFVFKDPMKIGLSITCTVALMTPIGIIAAIFAARRALPPTAAELDAPVAA